MKDLIKALTIMLKHGDVAHPCYCEHDTLYIYPNSMDFTEEEFATLENLGFIQDFRGLIGRLTHTMIKINITNCTVVRSK